MPAQVGSYTPNYLVLGGMNDGYTPKNGPRRVHNARIPLRMATGAFLKKLFFFSSSGTGHQKQIAQEQVHLLTGTVSKCTC